MGVKRTGDWELARRLVTGMPGRLLTATDIALRQEAQALRTAVVRGLTTQAPAGQPLKPLSPNTLAARRMQDFRGTKALVRDADLRNAIAAMVRNGRAFVGVPRKAVGPDGRPLADIAKVNEFGSGPIVIPITPKMRRFLFALRKESGGASGTEGGESAPGVIVTRIPARPFLRPVFEQFRRDADKRLLRRVAKQMKFSR